MMCGDSFSWADGSTQWVEATSAGAMYGLTSSGNTVSVIDGYLNVTANAASKGIWLKSSWNSERFLVGVGCEPMLTGQIKSDRDMTLIMYMQTAAGGTTTSYSVVIPSTGGVWADLPESLGGIVPDYSGFMKIKITFTGGGGSASFRSLSVSNLLTFPAACTVAGGLALQFTASDTSPCSTQMWIGSDNTFPIVDPTFATLYQAPDGWAFNDDFPTDVGCWDSWGDFNLYPPGDWTVNISMMSHQAPGLGKFKLVAYCYEDPIDWILADTIESDWVGVDEELNFTFTATMGALWIAVWVDVSSGSYYPAVPYQLYLGCCTISSDGLVGAWGWGGAQVDD